LGTASIGESVRDIMTKENQQPSPGRRRCVSKKLWIALGIILVAVAIVGIVLGLQKSPYDRLLTECEKANPDEERLDAMFREVAALLEDGCLFARTKAAETLGQTRDTRAVEPLIAALKDEDTLVCHMAADALGHIGDERAVEPLITMLHTENAGIAAEALGRIGDPRAIGPLCGKLTDWRANDRTVRALERLSWQPENERQEVHYRCIKRDVDWLTDPQNWDRARDILISDVASGRPDRVEFAVAALAGIGRDNVVDDLVRLIQTRGTVTMANAYFRCNQRKLQAAARSWAEKNGHEIMHISVSPSWGDW